MEGRVHLRIAFPGGFRNRATRVTWDTSTLQSLVCLPPCLPTLSRALLWKYIAGLFCGNKLQDSLAEMYCRSLLRKCIMIEGFFCRYSVGMVFDLDLDVACVCVCERESVGERECL